MPALASALRQAGVGPVSMMVGSLPITAAARMRARGFSPALRAALVEPTSISAAPSTMPDELPAWCMCSMRSTVVYLRSAVASKPIAPIIAKLGSSLAIASSVALARMVSSSVQHQQAGDVVHRHDALREAALRRAPRRAFWCERSAKASTSARLPAFQRGDQVGADALRHEAELLVDARVHEPGAAVAAHRPAAHALDAAGDHQVFEAARHLGGGQVHRLQARWRRSGSA